MQRLTDVFVHLHLNAHLFAQMQLCATICILWPAVCGSLGVENFFSARTDL